MRAIVAAETSENDGEYVNTGIGFRYNSVAILKLKRMFDMKMERKIRWRCRNCGGN
jgi:PHP family Zn ribbon phosphoesterase